MKIKRGDNVLVIAGNDKGKTGKVTRVIKKDNRVVVEGVHVVKKHIKPNRLNEKGMIVEVEAPIHASNVKVVNDVKDAKTKAPKKEAKKEAPKADKKKTTKKESEK